MYVMIRELFFFSKFNNPLATTRIADLGFPIKP